MMKTKPFEPEMTMGQRVTGHGSSGSTNLSGSRGSRDPLTRDQVNKIPRTGYRTSNELIN